MTRVFFALFVSLLFAGCSNEEHGEYYPDISTRELHYISRSGNIVEFNDDSFDAPIISNRYEKGVGIVKFASPLRSIGFLGSSDITSIEIPTTVTKFEDNPFRNCKNLARFISKYASSDGYALIHDGELIAVARNYRGENYTVPYGVKSIGANALYGSSIKSISIPNSVVKIGNAAFYGCDNLEELILPERLEELGREVCVNCSSLKQVSLPRSFTLADDFCGFVGCYNLEAFSGENASADGKCLIVGKTMYAFASAGVKEYDVPNSVTHIADRCFAETMLQKITLPATIQALGYGAFYNCTRLAEIYLEPTTPPTITSGVGSADVFGNLPSDYTLYVPSASYAKYTSDASWVRYEEHMQKYNF